MVWGKTGTNTNEARECLPRTLGSDALTRAAMVRVRVPEYGDGNLIIGVVRVRRLW